MTSKASDTAGRMPTPPKASQGEPSDRMLDDIIELLVAEPWKREEVKTKLLAWAEAGKLEARVSEVESMAVLAVDMPELLPLLAKRLEQLEAERRKLEGA